ncbi:beta-ribofuranosylaminobenzene 5'-phosphate synthase family protein [Desulfoscipio sp. XC116]|uniref:beta-ribofuranosylaminobenzene 5'-phosphate synthase family protein n=1 Tax=Desulfoscipio sp. XC116 TaxID=3144975 RepID=UPI00325A499A
MSLWVKVGARLHLGQLDLNGSLGRLYGGLGLAIDQPCLEITAEKKNDLVILGPEKEKKRLQRLVRKYLDFYGLPGVRLELLESLPMHSGLGSGTQLALAVGFAITRVYGLAPAVTELAVITDREGSRSGIGVAAFEQGGFFIDGGMCTNIIRQTGLFEVPPILARTPFPEEWAIILALPHKEEEMFGQEEVKAFASLPPMAEEISGMICRLLLMKLLPSLMEKDLVSFGQAVTEIQKRIGSHFTPVQGGIYASKAGADVAAYLLRQGAAGVGQSSWGPTIYAFTSRDKKTDLLEKTRNFLGKRGLVWTASGRNQGVSWGWKE